MHCSEVAWSGWDADGAYFGEGANTVQQINVDRVRHIIRKESTLKSKERGNRHSKQCRKRDYSRKPRRKRNETAKERQCDIKKMDWIRHFDKVRVSFGADVFLGLWNVCQSQHAIKESQKTTANQCKTEWLYCSFSLIKGQDKWSNWGMDISHSDLVPG